jgi:hypothetical protein
MKPRSEFLLKISAVLGYLCVFNFLFNWITNTYLVTALMILGTIILLIGAYYHKKSAQ